MIVRLVNVSLVLWKCHFASYKVPLVSLLFSSVLHPNHIPSSRSQHQCSAFVQSHSALKPTYTAFLPIIPPVDLSAPSPLLLTTKLATIDQIAARHQPDSVSNSMLPDSAMSATDDNNTNALVLALQLSEAEAALAACRLTIHAQKEQMEMQCEERQLCNSQLSMLRVSQHLHIPTTGHSMALHTL